MCVVNIFLSILLLAFAFVMAFFFLHLPPVTFVHPLIYGFWATLWLQSSLSPCQQVVLGCSVTGWLPSPPPLRNVAPWKIQQTWPLGLLCSGRLPASTFMANFEMRRLCFSPDIQHLLRSYASYTFLNPPTKWSGEHSVSDAPQCWVVGVATPCLSWGLGVKALLFPPGIFLHSETPLSCSQDTKYIELPPLVQGSIHSLTIYWLVCFARHRFWGWAKRWGFLSSGGDKWWRYE